MVKKLDWETIVQMMDNMLTGVLFLKMTAERMEIQYLNDGALRMLGYGPEGRRYITNLLSMIIEEDKDAFWQGIDDIMKDDGAVDMEFRTVTANGALRWIQARGNLYEMAEDGAVILCTFIDATERKFVENELHLQSEHYQKLLDSDREMLFDYNARTDVMTMKTGSSRGAGGDTIINNYLEKVRERAHTRPEEARAMELIDRLLRHPMTDTIELHIPLREWEDPKWYRISFTSIAGIDGYVTHIVGRMTDIDEQKKLELLVGDKDRLDSLTGYLNQPETKRIVNDSIAKTSRSDVSAFILIDLSDLRILRESFGEEMWKKLFRSVAEKVGSGFKRSDIIGRVTDDELVIYLPGIGSVANVDAVAARVSRSAEVNLGGDDGITISGKVGVSIYPYQGGSFDELLSNAEHAVESLSTEDKKGYHIYDLSGVYSQEAAEAGNVTTDETDADSVEEILWQMLTESKPNDNITRAMMKLVARAYGFHKTYLSIESEKQGDPLIFRYFEKGYEPKGAGPLDGDGNEAWFPVLKEMGLLGGIKILHSYDSMPPEVSDYMIRNSLHSLVIRPIMARGELAGVFLLGECSKAELSLDEGQRNQLRRILQIIHMHALRYERERAGRPLLTHARLLDDFDTYVMEIDYDTYEICFANRKILEAMPGLHIGSCCYKTYAGLNSPCPDCVMKKLKRENPHDHTHVETFSNGLRKWLKVYASWVYNTPEAATCLLNCMDISEYFSTGE